MIRIVDGLAARLAAEGVASASELTGAMRVGAAHHDLAAEGVVDASAPESVSPVPHG